MKLVHFLKPLSGAQQHGGVPQSGQGHRRFGQEMEEVCRKRMSREREVPAGVEK